ncbi:MAG: RNA polymerase factor sigma-54 [Burkholderiales bacterium]
MSSLSQVTEQRQQHVLSPRLQRAVRLLQLSSLDFTHELHGMMASNPFLEGDESDPDASSDFSPTDGDGTEADERESAAIASAGDAPAADTSHDQDNERDLWQADRAAGSSMRDASASGGDLSALDFMAATTSLASHLHAQINLLPLPERDRLLAKALIESLDDDGFLRIELAELAALAELVPPASSDEMRIALARVQALEPGVAARSVSECLLLQLPAIEGGHERELARRIVTDHLDRLAARDVPGLARRLSSTPAEIESVLARIRRLDPRPGWRFSNTQAAYITPDVVVKKVRGAWTVSLNPAVVPRVRLNRVYAEMFQRHRSAQNGALAGQLHEARWTVSNVEQRFATILLVAQAIVARQQRFLDFGPMAMKPLGLRAIADEVGLHESTVSRVTNNKFMATPLGVFELKHFFSRALATTSGKQVSGTAIRGLIKEMIAEELPSKPMSDPEIARRLAQQGLVVARRTVTKYRQCLGIEAVDRRARYA